MFIENVFIERTVGLGYPLYDDSWVSIRSIGLRINTREKEDEKREGMKGSSQKVRSLDFEEGTEVIIKMEIFVLKSLFHRISFHFRNMTVMNDLQRK